MQNRGAKSHFDLTCSGYLEVDHDSARTCIHGITAGNALHCDGECAVACLTVVLVNKGKVAAAMFKPRTTKPTFLPILQLESCSTTC